MENQTILKREQVIKVHQVRQAIGVLGMTMPFILIIGGLLRGCPEIQKSISAYYHTSMGDVFVGFLCAFAMFLFTYSGPEPIDSRVANAAGACALGVALFPSDIETPVLGCSTTAWYTNGKVHIILAAVFFLLLAYASFFLFTKTKDKTTMTERKKTRNGIYRFCGVTMVLCLVIIGLYWVWLEKVWPGMASIKPVLTFEAVALFVFGVSWLVKGELVLGDKA